MEWLGNTLAEIIQITIFLIIVVCVTPITWVLMEYCVKPILTPILKAINLYYKTEKEDEEFFWKSMVYGFLSFCFVLYLTRPDMPLHAFAN